MDDDAASPGLKPWKYGQGRKRPYAKTGRTPGTPPDGFKKLLKGRSCRTEAAEIFEEKPVIGPETEAAPAAHAT